MRGIFFPEARMRPVAGISNKKIKYWCLFFILLELIFTAPASTQIPMTEEIVVRFEVPRLFQKDIEAHYGDTTLYLPLIEIFSLLDMNVEADFADSVFSGSFISRDKKYEINLSRGRAKFSGNEIELKSGDCILTATELYLKIDMFDSLFGLKIYFDFATLTIYLPLNRDFPAYQKLARKTTHQQLQDAEAAQKDLYRLPYSKTLFGGGVGDWVVTANPLGGGSHYGNLNLGGMVLGGDLTLQGAVDSKEGFQSDQFRYRWHYYFKDNKYITQAELGEINTAGYLGRSLEGAILTNKPQIQRRYFQSVNLSGNPGAGWEVELYINNRLTDFAYTDQNGEYNFLVDINYGSSRVLLKMYGPNGEFQTEEKYVNVPFNLIPKKSFEYTAALGTSKTTNQGEKVAQGMAYYGIFNNLTAGLSADIPFGADKYETSATAGELTYHPIGNLMVNGSFSPKNAFKFSYNFSEPSIIGINGSFTKYYAGGYRNRLNQLSNIMFSVSSPLRIGKKSLGLRYHVSFDRYPNYDFINMNYGFNTSISRFHINYIGNYKIAEYSTRTDREMASQLFLSTSLIRWVRPQFRIYYDHRQSKISALGLYLNKRIFRQGQLSLSLERNVITRINQAIVTFNIFTGFADFSSKLYTSKDMTVFSQMQRGSIRFDQQAKTFRFDRKNGLGFGSAVVWPYLDENYNGVYDSGEQLLTELRARIGGATGTRNRKDKLYYYDDLRPYDEYILTVDPYSLDNPQLRPAHENFSVLVNPNTVTGITIPVITAGEITGMVDRKIPDGKVGVGGIRVIVTNQSTGKETEIVTFNNGEYYYLGLVPGMYKAEIDGTQLAKYGYASEPPAISFQVKTVQGGDYIDNINFLIVPKQ